MKSCLVVDDSPVVRKVARRILEDLQFVIEEAIDGKSAMDACRCKMPDPRLPDSNMPRLTAAEDCIRDSLRVAADAD